MKAIKADWAEEAEQIRLRKEKDQKEKKEKKEKEKKENVVKAIPRPGTVRYEDLEALERCVAPFSQLLLPFLINSPFTAPPATSTSALSNGRATVRRSRSNTLL